MTASEELMQPENTQPTKYIRKPEPEYEERWTVVVGKESFILDGEQVRNLKNATIAGKRGIVWFEGFAISIPHIQAIYRMSKRIKNQIEAPEESKSARMTPEERERAKKKIGEMRRDLSKIVSNKK